MKLKAFWYTKNEISETEKNPIYNSNKKIKYLGLNLTKEVKDLYSENYTVLKKEIKEDTNKWEHILCSWIGRINVIKMSTCPKQSIDAMQILSKYQWRISQI